MEIRSKIVRFFQFPVTRITVGLALLGAATVLSQFLGESLLKLTSINTDIRSLFTAVFSSSVALVSYIFLFRYYEQRKITELELTSFPRNALIGFLTGFCILSLVILIMYLGNSYTVIAVNPVSFLIPAIALAVSSGVFEELLFRGIIFRITESSLGSGWALVISSSFFGFAHLANPGSTVFSACAITIEAGLLLGTAYIYSRNLWLPILIHFAWNLSEGGIYGASVSGGVLSKSLITAKISGHELLTGGVFGPENSLQAVVLGLAVSVVFFWLARSKGLLMKPYWKRGIAPVSES